ncbi:hypothetical protein, partial [Klebsiella pneumoniae]|uniref:hypothetical protein n=1 Tax=Klebsiella pneumoniae TaxID=573 RepID=UPI0037133C31
ARLRRAFLLFDVETLEALEAAEASLHVLHPHRALNVASRFASGARHHVVHRETTSHGVLSCIERSRIA